MRDWIKERFIRVNDLFDNYGNMLNHRLRKYYSLLYKFPLPPSLILSFHFGLYPRGAATTAKIPGSATEPFLDEPPSENERPSQVSHSTKKHVMASVTIFKCIFQTDCDTFQPIPLDIFGPIQIYFGPFGPVWARLVPCVPICTHLDPLPNLLTPIIHVCITAQRPVGHRLALNISKKQALTFRFLLLILFRILNYVRIIETL